MEREILALPHQYSCGGFWLAERMPDRVTEIAYQGKMIPNNGKFYMLLSGRMEVLSEHQVERRMDCCRARGEIVKFQYAEQLPEGSILQL
jgi:hypothetical protein